MRAPAPSAWRAVAYDSGRYCANQWAISTPLSAQTRAQTLAAKAEGYGMPGIRVDGGDVLAVYDATRETVSVLR